MYEKQDFINEGIAIGKNEGQLLSAVTLLSNQMKKGKIFSEQSAIKFLSDNLDLSIELSKKAYQSVMQKMEHESY